MVKIIAPEIAGDINGNGMITSSEIAGDTNGDGKIDGIEIAGDPTVQLKIVSNQIICNGSTSTPVIFSVENTGGTTTYAWTNSNSGIGLAVSGTGNIAAFSAINTGALPAVATIQVIPIFTIGLVSRIGQAKSFTFKVNPSPAAVAGANRSICSGTSSILGTAAVAGNAYSWSSVPTGFTSTAANPAVNP